MKTMFLTLIAIFGLAVAVSAHDPETITVRQGRQKTAPHSKVTVKLVSVTEDSRCPKDANCVWSGNATVNVKVTDPDGVTKLMTMNTDRGPKGDQNNGWAVYLTSLTPATKSGKAIAQKSYTATFTITRLQR